MGDGGRSNHERGLLFEYKLPEGRPLRSIEIQDGDRFHPGGMMADGASLWIPVAEYKKESTAVIQKRRQAKPRIGVSI